MSSQHVSNDTFLIVVSCFLESVCALNLGIRPVTAVNARLLAFFIETGYRPPLFDDHCGIGNLMEHTANICGSKILLQIMIPYD